MNTQIHAQYLESTEICGNFMNAPVLRVTAMTAPTTRQLHAQITETSNALFERDESCAPMLHCVSERQKMLRGQMDYAVSTHNAAAFKLGKARLERLASKIRAHSIAIELLDNEIKGL